MVFKYHKKKERQLICFSFSIIKTNKEANHIKQYLSWLFSIHEMFGRIPDFKYPAEIVSFAELQVAVARLVEMELSAIENKAENYDSMVWCHSLSQPWVGAVNPENVPEHWKELFPSHTTSLLLSFLNDLKRVVLTGADVSHLHPEIYEIPFSQPELSHYIDNLGNRGLVRLLKLIPFEESPVYADIVLEMVLGREFMGKCLFTKDSTEHLYHPYFRFGVVASMEE